jgi:hypothetical protein
MMLLFQLAGCCCCFPCGFGRRAAQPLPPDAAHLAGDPWVCEDGQAWTFREDGTYIRRESDLEPTKGRFVEVGERWTALDDLDIDRGLVETQLTVDTAGGCLVLNGAACARVEAVPNPAAVGAWRGSGYRVEVRSDGLVTVERDGEPVQAGALGFEAGVGAVLVVCGMPSVPLPFEVTDGGLVSPDDPEFTLEDRDVDGARIRARIEAEEAARRSSRGGGSSSRDYDYDRDYDFD